MVLARTRRGLALAGCLALSAVAARAGGWELVAPMPAPKANTFAVRWGGDIYMVGGSPWTNGADEDGSVYRLHDGAWSSAATLEGMGPTVGQGGGVDALNRIVVFGGLVTPSGDLGEPRIYHPVQGTTDTPADVSNVHPPQNFGLATDAQGRIYRLGGGCDACIFNTGICSRYDGPTDTWQSIAYLPYSRSSIASCFDGQGHIWGFGGYTSFGSSRLYDTIRYTVATDTWVTLGSLFLPVQTSDAKAVLGADGRVYCIGGLVGSGAGTPTTAVYVLDPGAVDPVLQAGPPLNIARHEFGVALGDDGYVYVIGGLTASGPTSTVERLYTGACPQITGHSPSQQAQPGQQLVLTGTATGGAPLAFQWEREGVALDDGPTGHGSTLAGTATSTLTIGAIAAADAGTYTLTASNACGSATSGDIVITLPTAWADLGLGKAGSAGTPRLSGSGPLAAGTANQLDLADAAPGAPATLVFGLAQADAPFKGGTLVPVPLLLVTLATGPGGALALPFTWPSGVAPGTELLFQFWIQDAGASQGLSASNGLHGVAD